MSSTTTQGGGIFTFDHGQKKLYNAIGVNESYLDDLQDQMKQILKEFVFDSDKQVNEDMSPSRLVEICATEFSYSQLVVMASFFLQETLDGFAKKIENATSKMKGIALDADELPENIKDMLDQLAKDRGEGNAISSDDVAPELRDFLMKMIKRQMDEENED
jgi:hypothetical protein